MNFNKQLNKVYYKNSDYIPIKFILRYVKEFNDTYNRTYLKQDLADKNIKLIKIAFRETSKPKVSISQIDYLILLNLLNLTIPTWLSDKFIK